MEKLRKPGRDSGQENERKREQRQQHRTIHSLNPVEDAMDKNFEERADKMNVKASKTRMNWRQMKSFLYLKSFKKW
jgi:hypothetical protein